PWLEYAWLGESEANYVLTNHPEYLISAAKPSLHWAPKSTLPYLLKASIGDKRLLHSSPDHPLRIINDWVQGVFPGSDEGVKRRKVLFGTIEKWLAENGDTDVALLALRSVFSPSFEMITTEPGSGNTVTMRHGYLLLDDLRAIQELWLQANEMLKSIEITNWDPLRIIVEEWAYSRQPGVTLSDDLYQFKRDFAVQLLHDVASLAQNHLGVLRWVRRVARALEVTSAVQVNIDEDFDVLYPEEDLDKDWRKQQEEQAAEVRKLADIWARSEPTEIASRLAHIEKEASLVGRQWPRWTPYLCQEIAERSETPSIWAAALMMVEVTGDLVFPFLYKAAEIMQSGWEKHVDKCLERSSLRAASLRLVLTLPDPPGTLLEKAFGLLDDHHGLVESLCLRSEIPENRVRQLLRHKNVSVAQAAARGEWASDPKGVVRDSLREDWRRVVINAARADYWIREALKNDPDLAYTWLTLQMDSSYSIPDYYSRESPFQAAVLALTLDHRRTLLKRVTANTQPELVFHLVGKAPELYRDLLENELLKDFHLIPLSGSPDEAWVDLARVASHAGYSPRKIALAAFSIVGVVVHSGPESMVWSEWEKRFEAICVHDDELLQEIGKSGIVYASSQRKRAEKRERHEGIYGWG
ncbi:MAG: hypothetical protein KDE28_08010, partial [Anaerolineales bacterium]|nr:hypothetical protein [Anaerolineales bacterium]